MNAQWQNDRKLRERIVVTARLTLDTPTHLGNGDSDGLFDMPLHLDALDGCALLTGASMAGALRNYVRQYRPDLASRLFGEMRNGQSEESPSQSIQSQLVIDDAFGNQPETELRDGVAIDPKSHTAEDKKKYDIELLTAGTTFALSFELLLLCTDDDELLAAFVLALQALESGAIRLGKRKRRGFGRCRASHWSVQRYDMTKPNGMIQWLCYETDATKQTMSNGDTSPKESIKIAELFKLTLPDYHQATCTLNAVFRLDGSLLIRSAEGEANAADFVHLRSKRQGNSVPILSGTSLAGALRARALRIANTIGKNGECVVNQLFGYRPTNGNDNTKLTASRLWVEETVVHKPLELVQSRVKLDRFTGSAFPGALFSEEAVFGATHTRIEIRLFLPNHQDHEVGLLLLLLKDLWTGDLPLGGEASVGRGRLSGEHADLTVGDQHWCITQGENGKLQIDRYPQKLETFVQQFWEQWS